MDRKAADMLCSAKPEAESLSAEQPPFYFLTCFYDSHVYLSFAAQPLHLVVLLDMMLCVWFTIEQCYANTTSTLSATLHSARAPSTLKSLCRFRVNVLF